MELFAESELAASFAQRFIHRILHGESAVGAVQDTILGGLVAAYAVRVGLVEAQATLDLAFNAVGDPEVVATINAKIKKTAEKK